MSDTLPKLGLTRIERYNHFEKLQHEATPTEVAHEKVLCASSIEHFADHYITTFDVKGEHKVEPFNLFPKQRDLLRWIAAYEHVASTTSLDQQLIVEKCRDVGATWVFCLHAVHGWLYRPLYTVGIGANKLETVDELNNPRCIFDKLRWIIRCLPKMFLPKGFNDKKHMGYCKIINPENGSTICGEGGRNIGRGGRTDIYCIDEAAEVEHADEVDAALFSNAKVRIDISTARGPNNNFARKRHAFDPARVFTINWYDDPRKNPRGHTKREDAEAASVWYIHNKNHTDPKIFAQNVEIDYYASDDDVAIPAAWVNAAINLPLTPTGPRVGGLDLAGKGSNYSVLAARQGPVVLSPLISWQKLGPTQSAARARLEANKLGLSTVTYDALGGWGEGVEDAWASTEASLEFAIEPFNAGAPPTTNVWPDGQTSKQLFVNLRAEMWWSMRCRFERTFEHKQWLTTNGGEGAQHPESDLISIPDDPELIAQFSMPRYELAPKIQIESKKAMLARGIKSPDKADATIMAFFIPPPPVGLFRRRDIDAALANQYQPIEL